MSTAVAESVLATYVDETVARMHAVLAEED